MLFTQAYYTEVSLIVWHIISKSLILYDSVNRELVSSRLYYQFKGMFSDLYLRLFSTLCSHFGSMVCTHLRE